MNLQPNVLEAIYIISYVLTAHAAAVVDEVVLRAFQICLLIN
jgi:hypothetical protein